MGLIFTTLIASFFLAYKMVEETSRKQLIENEMGWFKVDKQILFGSAKYLLS